MYLKGSLGPVQFYFFLSRVKPHLGGYWDGELGKYPKPLN